MILRITDAASANGRALVISTAAPPPELVEELARAAYGLDDWPAGVIGPVQEAYRNNVRRVLVALAEKVKT